MSASEVNEGGEAADAQVLGRTSTLLFLSSPNPSDAVDARRYILCTAVEAEAAERCTLPRISWPPKSSNEPRSESCCCISAAPPLSLSLSLQCEGTGIGGACAVPARKERRGSAAFGSGAMRGRCCCCWKRGSLKEKEAARRMIPTWQVRGGNTRNWQGEEALVVGSPV